MKRIVLLLCINLLTAIVCSSQTIYPQIASDSTVIISHKQLKQTNLIFLEHKKFKEVNEELNNQIINPPINPIHKNLYTLIVVLFLCTLSLEIFNSLSK